MEMRHWLHSVHGQAGNTDAQLAIRLRLPLLPHRCVHGALGGQSREVGKSQVFPGDVKWRRLEVGV